MKKIRIVAWREFFVVARTPMFWLSTFGFPIFMAACFVVPLLIAMSVSDDDDDDVKPESPHHYGILDPDSLLPWGDAQFWEPAPVPESTPPDLEFLPPAARPYLEKFLTKKRSAGPKLSFALFDNRQAGVDALEAGDVRAVLIFGPGFRESHEVEIILPDEDTGYSLVRRKVQTALRDDLLRNAIPGQETDTILKPLASLTVTYLEEPEAEEEEIALFDKLRRYALPGVMVFMMAMPLMLAMDRLLRGVVEEKENRVVEVLLSSVSADELLFGKVLGLSALAFTQAIVWLAFAVIPLVMMLAFFKVGAGTILLMALLFVLGYLFTATAVLGLGSLGTNLQESTQMTLVVMLGWMSTLFLIQPVVENPDSVLARVLTYIPMTGPGVILTRFMAGGLPTWELIVSLAVMVGWVWLALKFGTILFRLGIMSTGRMPKIREVWYALRGASV